MSVCVRLQYSMRGAFSGRMITGPLHTLRFLSVLCVIVCCDGGTAVVCVCVLFVCVCVRSGALVSV